MGMGFSRAFPVGSVVEKLVVILRLAQLVFLGGLPEGLDIRHRDRPCDVFQGFGMITVLSVCCFCDLA